MGQEPGPGPPTPPRGWGTPAAGGWTPPPPGPVPGRELASWGRRALALVVDSLILAAMATPGIALLGAGAATDSDGTGPDQANAALVAAGLALMLAALAVQFWQQGWRQGARGQSWGKQLLGIGLVRRDGGQPPGGGVGLGRMLLRLLLGNASCGLYTLLTYLWPLWDADRQTLDDKIVGTVVVVWPPPA
jgi:uncharacterized RDD family membrane protein YckC